MTNADKLRSALRMALTSDAKRKTCDYGREMLLTTAASITEWTARLDKEKTSGTSAGEEHAEQQLTTAKNDSKRLQLTLNAADTEIIALEAAEDRASVELRSALATTNAKRTALIALHRKDYPELERIAKGLLSETLDTAQSTAALLRAAQRAPARSRAEVKIDLVPLTLFAPGSGAGTLIECITILPALADPDAPASHLPRHWPPVPVAPPRAPAEPRAAPGPSIGKSWTLIKEFVPPPGPFADDDSPTAP